LVSIGPTAVLSSLTGQALDFLMSQGSVSGSRAEAASLLALYAGLLMAILGSVSRFSSTFMHYLSPSILAGFCSGSATVIIIQQVQCNENALFRMMSVIRRIRYRHRDKATLSDPCLDSRFARSDHCFPRSHRNPVPNSQVYGTGFRTKSSVWTIVLVSTVHAAFLGIAASSSVSGRFHCCTNGTAQVCRGADFGYRAILDPCTGS
jgi:hypothetical protein